MVVSTSVVSSSLPASMLEHAVMVSNNAAVTSRDNAFFQLKSLLAFSYCNNSIYHILE